MADWLWQPGESGNPNGRPIGARNKRTKEIVQQIISSGATDPLVRLSELVSSEDEFIAATASNMLAPFMHSKLMATPTPRYIENSITLPHQHPTSPQQVDANIAHIIQAFASGNLDLDFYNALLAGQREYIVSFKAREELPANQDIHVTGGLPALPGTNITMPQLNGHTVLGLVAPNDPPITPPQDPDTPPAIPPEQDEGI